jgi:phage terminase small subunit
VGKRGPARDPTALRLLKGARTNHARPINKHEPKFDGDPVPSVKVKADVDALKIWDEKSPELIEKGVLTFQDSTAFSTYCLLCAMRDRLWEQIRKLGEEGAIGKGIMKAFLATDIRCDRWGAKFGLSPSDRSSIVAIPKQKPVGGRKFLV